MKILLICSSPRKSRSRTFALAKEVMKGFGSSKEAEIIHLCDHKIDFCRQCEMCHRKILNCPIKDDTHIILKKMLAADGIILATPNYINHITASMKSLMERASHFIHCKRLSGKYVACVVSSGGGHDNDVLDYVKYYAHTCGAQYSGGVASAAAAIGEKFSDARMLGKKLREDIKKKRQFRDQIRTIEEGRKHFKRVIMMRKEDWPEEYQYWKKRNWFDM